MKNLKKIALVAILALTVSCSQETLTDGQNVNSKELTYLTNEKLATCRTLASSIVSNSSSYEVLSSNKFDNLNELLLSDLFNLLKTDKMESDQLISNIEKDGIPGCFIHNEKKLSQSNLKEMLIMFSPFSDNATVIEGVDLRGNVVTMNVTASKEYDGVILFVDQQGKFEAEKSLKQANAASNGTAKVTLINNPWQVVSSIRCVDDHEPWIKGAAEVYSIVFDYQITNFKLGMTNADMRIAEFDFLKYDGTNYTNVNRHFLEWNQVPSNFASVYFYERDANVNYANLASVVVLAATGVAVSAGVALPASVRAGIAFTTVASPVLNNFFANAATDTDDLMDIFYAIDKPSVQNVTQTFSGSLQNITMSHYLRVF